MIGRVIQMIIVYNYINELFDNKSEIKLNYKD